MCHALRAGKVSHHAVEYRSSLWSSIRRARGFQEGFPTWWARRKPLLCADPVTLPIGPPCIDVMEDIFEEFQMHFRKFEGWHLKQRTKVLSAKHQASSRQLHRELRPPRKDTPDLFWYDEEFEILAIDEDDNFVQLDRSPSFVSDCIWLLDERHIIPFDFDGPVCKLPLYARVELGSCLVQRTFVTDLSSLHAHLCNFWKKRWQGAAEVPVEHWQRLTSFAQAYLPHLDLRLPPLRSMDLRRTATKMKVAAARGLDGVSRADVLHLPDKLLDDLTSQLKAVEGGAQWHIAPLIIAL